MRSSNASFLRYTSVMPAFHVTGVRDGEKKIFSDDREAHDKQELIEMLRKEGVTALSIETPRTRSKRSLNFDIPFLSRVKSADKIVFSRNLAAMLAAGLPLSRAIGILARQTRSKLLRQTIEGVEHELREGFPLNAAFARYPKVFSPLLVAMARAGEASGTLADALMTAAVQMEKSYTLRKKIRGAMIYPAIVLTVMAMVGVIMLIYVVPQLAATFASLGTTLPLPTRIVLGVSTFVLSYSVLLITGIIVLVAAIVLLLRTNKGKRIYDRALLRIPIVGGITVKSNCARTARTLAALLKAGVSPLVALEITEEAVANTRFRDVIASARGVLEKGRPLSQAFLDAGEVYPPMFSEMAAVGEETGDIAGMLARVAEFYETDVEEETKDMSTIIEPILMVVIGAGVGFFAISMIAPIYSMSNSL